MDTHENNNQLLSATDKQFADCIRRGDDFFRIELFKSAKEMFRKALTYRDNEADTLAKIDECDRLIKRDTKRVLVCFAIYYHCGSIDNMPEIRKILRIFMFSHFKQFIIFLIFNF